VIFERIPGVVLGPRIRMYYRHYSLSVPASIGILVGWCSATAWRVASTILSFHVSSQCYSIRDLLTRYATEKPLHVGRPLGSEEPYFRDHMCSHSLSHYLRHGDKPHHCLRRLGIAFMDTTEVTESVDVLRDRTGSGTFAGVIERGPLTFCYSCLRHNKPSAYALLAAPVA
jgi:hypothetical protein